MNCEACRDGGRLVTLYAKCALCLRVRTVIGIGGVANDYTSLRRSHDKMLKLQPTKKGSTTMPERMDSNGRTLASYIENFTLHAPGLDDGEHSKGMIDVLNVIVRDAITWRVASYPDSVLIYRGTLVFTSAAVRAIFSRILQDCGQAPSQLRSYYYECKNNEDPRPALTVYALQATGNGGIWNWAEDSKLVPDKPIPPERCASILTIPRLDPAPHPGEGPYGTICYTKPVIAGSMVKANNYQQAAATLPPTTPPYVQPLERKGSVGGNHGV